MKLLVGLTLLVLVLAEEGDWASDFQRELSKPGSKDAWDLFQQFIQKYNRVYAGGKVEMMRRFKIFKSNLKLISIYQQFERGTAKYGLTPFADLSPAEFRKIFLNPAWDFSAADDLAEAQIPDINIPENYDWRDHNAVTPVKNQGQCGSCWAFSVTGNIEGQWAVHKGKLVSLSEQELVDCDKLDQGCNGGLPLNAYKEIVRLGGLELESDYAYRGRDQQCHLDKSKIKVKISSGIKISEDEKEMAQWLVKNGPISIGINAAAMQFYFGGISHPWKFMCSPSHLDHGVLITGYGVKNGTPFWTIKNSWGTGWGSRGYYYIYRGDGSCGVNKMATSAQL